MRFLELFMCAIGVFVLAVFVFLLLHHLYAAVMKWRRRRRESPGVAIARGRLVHVGFMQGQSVLLDPSSIVQVLGVTPKLTAEGVKGGSIIAVRTGQLVEWLPLDDSVATVAGHLGIEIPVGAA